MSEALSRHPLKQFYKVHGAKDQVFHHRLKLRPTELHIQVLGSTLICRDMGEVNFGLVLEDNSILAFWAPPL
ncbi:MAG: hypothetical protein Ct9H300mP14_13500 [Gammaproteobacteria bacterium]|nr:MAG: hypothetical protein Ct9H300mP14_13500 [Gammaproteobacteria bacterium]